MLHKFILSLSLALLANLGLHAQGRVLSLLEGNPDIRSVAMGHSLLGNSQEMYLYANPASFVGQGRQLSVDLAGEWFPSTDEGRLSQYSLSLGYRLHKSGAIFAGVRRLSGLTLPTTNLGEAIKPYDQSIDLGYALGITPHITAYASASYLRSYVGTLATGVSLSFGLSYRRSLKVADLSSTLMLGARLLDVGKPIKYDDTKLPHSLPSSLALGGEWAVRLSPKHSLSYALSSRIFTASEGDRELYASTGLEYSYKQSLSLRAGYRYTKLGSDLLTMGLGLELSQHFRLNLAYSYATARYGVDTFLFGAGFKL